MGRIGNLSFRSLSGGTVFGNGGAASLSATTGCTGAPPTCPPAWKTRLSATSLNVPPAVAAGRLLVPEIVQITPTADVEIFDAAGQDLCSGTPRTCTPLMRYVTNGSVQGIAATGTLAFVSSSATVQTGAKLMAYDLAGVTGCSGSPVACNPLWTAPLDSSVGFPWGPTVANGLVAIGGDGGSIKVFAIPQ